MSNISQREARRLKRRVEQLESLLRRQRNCWSLQYPGGAHIGSITNLPNVADWVRVSRLLGHAVVAINNGTDINLFALPHPAEDA